MSEPAVEAPKPLEPSVPSTPRVIPDDGILHIPLLGNPNTGKTTLFNALCGLRHKTSNFPGTTQDARIGSMRAPSTPAAAAVEIHLIDLPGIYSLELDQSEAEVCRNVLAGRLSPRSEPFGDPEGVCVVIDATNLPRNLVLVGEVLRRRLPTVIALNMMDLARQQGRLINIRTLEEQLGCRVIAVSARSGEGLPELTAALSTPTVPTRTPPGDQAELELWADRTASRALGASASGLTIPNNDAQSSLPSSIPSSLPKPSLTDRLDPILVSPWTGVPIFAAIMIALFYTIFSVAHFPMDWIDAIFAQATQFIESHLPAGILRDLLSHGIVAGVGATVIFVPQICLLFFLISLLEDTGYLARAALLMDRVLRPFGLPGHAFVPLLSSHACALPGIMSARVIPDPKDRLATILVAPFMTCSARLPVYVLVTSLLFRDKPFFAGLAFVGCYALGAGAGLFSALIARRTLLKGKSRPMVLELPTYKLPSLRTAGITTLDRGWVFLKNAGTNILAICIVLWWLGSYPHVTPPAEATVMQQQAAELRLIGEAETVPEKKEHTLSQATTQAAAAERLIAAHAREHSYIGRMGKALEPVFRPLGYDWQLTIGVLTSFAAREVFVSTMAVVVRAGDADLDPADAGAVKSVQAATRTDGVTPIFTTATCWSILVYFVLAMQCLPTLAVTAKESGSPKWALLQFAWMSGVAYAAAFIVYQALRAAGVA
ncbi:MAG: ferrous iron transporter B [Phycisphaerales bacterium]|nr:ferrous iron transporter B [Phycisphaerales bacterium]